MHKPTNKKRRDVLKSLSLGASSILMAPYIWAQEKPVLRVLGAHQTLYEDIRLRAQEDLGFKIEFAVGEHATVTHKAATHPESFDIFEKTAEYIDILWNSGAIQPIEKNRIREWSSIGPLEKIERVTPDARTSQGNTPYMDLNVLPDNSLGATSTDRISFLPYVHNVDAFGYLTDSVEPGENTESWSWLLDERNHGKVGIILDPAVGFNELALAAQASGKVSIHDPGNMSRNEIDNLVRLLVDLKKSGHFSGFWSTVPESTKFISSGRTQIQSMFAPAFYSLKSQGIRVSYAVPKEGYRAWQGAICLSAKASPSARDMAYEYMNWWMSGWPGAYITRQGYYTSNPGSARPYLSSSEWNYWYEGKPADTDLAGIDGKVAVQKGERRPGGSYTERLSNITIWNGITIDYEYKLSGWYDFLTA